MQSKFLLITSILLSACSQADQKQPSQSVDHGEKNPKPMKVEEEEVKISPHVENHQDDEAIATFKFQKTADERLMGNCVWTDDPHAEAQYYWAVLLSNEINGQSKFSKEELQTEKVNIGKNIKNCSGGAEDEKQKYAYEIDREGDLVNFVALKLDRMTQNTDKTYSIDLNKNGTPEKIFVCYNMESMNVFFIEPSKDHPYLKQVNVQLSYDIDGELDQDISCGKVFYQKSGIIAKENPQTGEYIYTLK